MPSLSALRRDLALFARYHLVRRAAQHPAREETLGIVPLGYEPRAYVDAIRSHEDHAAITVLEELSYDGERYPMLEVRTGKAGGPRLLVLAGVHGNEHAGLFAIPPILERLRADPPAVDLTIITPVNPVGAAHLSRFNAQGYDINRDFVRFETAEARAVRAVIDRLAPDFVVSLHEGPQDATFMFANRRVDPGLAARLLEAMESGGTALAERDYFGRRLRPAGYAPMGAMTLSLSWLWARTLGMMASGMYAGERGIPELTLESSWRLSDREARVRAHADLVLALAGELAR